MMIQKIEELSINAFPALSTVLLNGWILRFSNGYSKRANSVNPIYDCSMDVLKNIEICEDMYSKKGLDTVFKLVENQYSYDIDDVLAKRGYSYEAKTNILLKNIHNFNIAEEEGHEAVVYKEFNDSWFEAYACMNKLSEKNALTLKEMLHRAIPDLYFACIMEEGAITAVGLGAAEGEYVGMFGICVHESRRRKGLGTKIMNSLTYEASKGGCTCSYLQVVDANEPAKRLYDKLGYKKLYSYWYRIRKNQK